MIGAQASSEQLEKILSYFDIGKQEGAEVLTGGKRAEFEGEEMAGGYYVQPTVFKRQEQYARLPGRDLWTGGQRDHI